MASPHRIIVIGAGAAGLMAAGQAAASGADVLLLEKMADPARKLRITGGGRCNLTNTAPLPEFIGHLGPNGRFLRQAFSSFFSSELLAFFEALQVPTVAETPDGRVFPKRGDAREVVEALVRWAQAQGAELLSRSTVKRFKLESGRVSEIEVERPDSDRGAGSSRSEAKPRLFRADRIILATGGASYPATGSTGDGYRLARSAGHTIVPIRPALVPLVTSGRSATGLQGLSLPDVALHFRPGERKGSEVRGEMLFTHFGISGPAVLNLSKQCVDALRRKEPVKLVVDLVPSLDPSQLDERLRSDLDRHGKQQFRSLLSRWVPRRLVAIAAAAAAIPEEKLGHQITASERKRVRDWLKGFPLEIVGHRPLREAMVTAGGVDLREVDPRTLRSKLVNNLYLCGEVLDLDGDTGGYNLQTAFSTGWLAGRSAAQAEP